MAAVLHDRLLSLPDEPRFVRSENNFLKCAESNSDLDDIFLEAKSQPLLDDSTMLAFMLQENVSPCDRGPLTELQPISAEPRDKHRAPHRQGAEAKKRTRIESIVLSERLRRKKTRHMFSTLHSLLKIPATTKLSRHCLIEETGKCIQSLQIQLRELKTKRDQLVSEKEFTDGAEADNPHHRSSNDCERRLPFTTDHNVSVDVFGTEVIVRITSFRMPRHLWRIYEELEANDLDVQRADVYSGDSIVFLHFHANCSDQTSMLIRSKCSLQINLQCIY